LGRFSQRNHLKFSEFPWLFVIFYFVLKRSLKYSQLLKIRQKYPAINIKIMFQEFSFSKRLRKNICLSEDSLLEESKMGKSNNLKSHLNNTWRFPNTFLKYFIPKNQSYKLPDGI